MQTGEIGLDVPRETTRNHHVPHSDRIVVKISTIPREA